MQNPVLDEICTTIYTDINAILLKYKANLQKKTTRDMIKAEVVAYLNQAMTRHLVNVIPTVKVETNPNDPKTVLLRFYDPETGHLIDAIDKIVKMPVNWNVGEGNA